MPMYVLIAAILKKRTRIAKMAWKKVTSTVREGSATTAPMAARPAAPLRTACCQGTGTPTANASSCPNRRAQQAAGPKGFAMARAAAYKLFGSVGNEIGAVGAADQDQQTWQRDL